MTRYKVEFVKDGEPLEIVYWLDCHNVVVGEAYFRKDDMLADIRDGIFTHPWYEKQFKLTVPSAFFGSKDKECTLEVLRYVPVGRTKSFPVVENKNPTCNHFV